jgi:hypothetical protein
MALQTEEETERSPMGEMLGQMRVQMGEGKTDPLMWVRGNSP